MFRKKSPEAGQPLKPQETPSQGRLREFFSRAFDLLPGAGIYRRFERDEEIKNRQRAEELSNAYARARRKMKNSRSLDELYRKLCEEITKMGLDEARILRIEANGSGGRIVGRKGFGTAGEIDCTHVMHDNVKGNGHISADCANMKAVLHLQIDRVGREVALTLISPKSGDLVEREEISVSEEEKERIFANAMRQGVFEKIAFPLLDGEEVIGVIVADNRESHKMIKDDVIAALARIASDAADYIKMKEEAIVDELTGLHGRRYADNRMAEEFKKLKRAEEDAVIAERAPQPVVISIAMFDLDDFKQINDRHGHGAGDAVLKALAETARENTREEDTFARIGGEEFLLCMPGANRQQAAARAEKLRRTMEDAVVEYEGKKISFTVSFGVAQYNPRRDRDLEGAKKRADDALYFAKNSGKNKGFEDIGEDRQVFSEIKPEPKAEGSDP